MFRCCKMMPNEFLCSLPIARLSRNFSHFFSFCSLSAVSRLNFHRQRMNDVSWKSFLSLHLHWILRVCDENRRLFSSSLVSTFLLLMMMTTTSSLRLCLRWRIRVMITWSIGRRAWWWVCGLEKMRKSITIIDSREMLRIVISSFFCVLKAGFRRFCHLCKCGLMVWGWCLAVSLPFEFYDACALKFES